MKTEHEKLMAELTIGAHRAALLAILVAVTKKNDSAEKTNRPESRETDKEKVAHTLSRDEGLEQKIQFRYTLLSRAQERHVGRSVAWDPVLK